MFQVRRVLALLFVGFELCSYSDSSYSVIQIQAAQCTVGLDLRSKSDLSCAVKSGSICTVSRTRRVRTVHFRALSVECLSGSSSAVRSSSKRAIGLVHLRAVLSTC